MDYGSKKVPWIPPGTGTKVAPRAPVLNFPLRSVDFAKPTLHNMGKVRLVLVGEDFRVAPRSRLRATKSTANLG